MASHNLAPLSDDANRNKKSDCEPSASVIKRLPKYFRYLRALLNNDILRVSSGQLAKSMGTSSSQIRQDLNCFGDFGQQGYGYNVKYLYTQMSRILGVGKKMSAVIVSGGNTPAVLNDKALFETRGIRVRGVFTDKSDGEASLASLEELCQNEKIDIAVLCVSEHTAQQTAQLLAQYGIRGIWNFSSGEILPPDDTVSVQNVLYGDSLMLLMYDILQNGD